MHVERTFTVARPIEEVFAYLGDFTHTEQWDPGTVTTTRTGGDGGLGTTYANTSEFMGRRVELTYETITYEQPTRVQFRGKNKSATATDSLSFSPAPGGGTAIHYRADFDFGLLGNLVVPLVIRRKLDKVADETIEQMRRALA
ncbi:SRPBCC family protein [Nocardioides psychrotolerans]|uniref:SRPBCC family protein n=1 Tax=Nocardioides psychrotolerans TaxID=1005945 RepID=UPI00313811CF